MSKTGSYCLQGLLAAVAVAVSLPWIVSTQTRGGVAIDPDDIGGVVTSSKGPEAGVWVIAETTDLPTKFARIVVTDDQGRYVLPDLPKANYNVWVRGYGLVDSEKVLSIPGKALNLTAVLAPNGQAAAQYYPPNYWLSIMKFPPGRLKPEELARSAKCALSCHGFGGKATREITPETAALGPFNTTEEAWLRRLKSGPNGAAMSGAVGRLGPQFHMFADWTDSIAKGEYPMEAPPRPAGVERNLVVSLWDWGPTNGYIHDAATGDRRNPTVNANGPVYGASQTHDVLYWVDPVKNTEGSVRIPLRDSDVEAVHDGGASASNPDPKGLLRLKSPYWGEDPVWSAKAVPRSGVIDQKGRVWMGFRIRRTDNQPAFCKTGSTNKFARYFPLDPKPGSNVGGKQTGYYDPKTQQWTFVDTCWWVDHNDFAEDPDNTLFTGMDDVIGWVNTRVWDASRDEQASQGWCPLVIDTNGDGRITKPWTEPDQPVDATKDHRISVNCYSVSVNPKDNSVWCNGSGRRLVRVDRGTNPPETCRTEVYEAPDSAGPGGSRGVDIGTDGLAWVNFTGAEFIASFDRTKCKVLNGPNATGHHCDDGWKFYSTIDHPFKNAPTVATTFTYLLNVDRLGALGLGKDTPVTYPETTDSLIALNRETGKWVSLRVPYPMNALYTKHVTGRVDDPKAGWKGRALWSNTGNYSLWHIEGGKGTKGKLMKFQIRPDPLAK
jgi:hypothetical protein